MGAIDTEELLAEIKECDMSKPFAFVSYSKKDSEKVYKVVRELQKNGYNIWMDKELKKSVGVDWQQEAFTAIGKPKCKVILFFVSENSMISAPVCAELCWSKSEKAVGTHKGEELKIIPINVSEQWDYKIPFSGWVNEIAEKYEDDELRTDDYDVLRDIIDDKYISGKSRFEYHSEIATFIMKNIFDPLGGNKVTFTNYNDIQTIMDNMRMTREEVKEKEYNVQNDKECIQTGNPSTEVQKTNQGDASTAKQEKTVENKIYEMPQISGGEKGSKITIGEVRAMLSEPPVAKEFRAVREGMPRGGKGAMDYVMAAVLGGCNSITEKSFPYQINYYLYDVASEDESKKKNDGKLGATWTWSSNCRKVIDLQGAGQIPKELNKFFEDLPEETTLGVLEEHFRLGTAEAFRTKKNEVVVFALQRLIEFVEKNV